MSINHQEDTIEGIGQSPGCDPKASKRNSGLFSFLRWFRPSTSRESVDTDAQNSPHSSSCDSLNSVHSNGTVASFSFIPPSAYKNRTTEKAIILGPETDTYKARLKQREKRRENDKNLTLRKKYNLFFQKEAVLQQEDDDNTKSLPLMTRKTVESDEEKTHRRTASESSKIKKAGAYCHVKGKRKAPQPPVKKNQDTSTMSLRRKKRIAPAPPEKLKNSDEKYETIEYADADVIFNDSLKLDHGILKPAKETEGKSEQTSPNTSARSSYVEAPVSPRPWYKRNTSRESLNSTKKDSQKVDHKYEQIESLPEVQFKRNSTLDLTLAEEPKHEKKKEDKRKSTLSFLTNISELDREASEIVKKEHQKDMPEMPEFMRPKQQNNKINTDSWLSPRRRSAKDLISKFNAITNVTKVTVNSAFFGSKESASQNLKRDYFGKQASLNEDKKENDVKCTNTSLMKSESTSAIKNKPETPKFNRKTWYCPKCSIENDYWRIICHVCSTIKPYFDDLTSPPIKNAPPEKTLEELPKESPKPSKSSPERILERSRTQIGFSALAKYNENRKTSDKTQKDVEKEKLKKMLIEMKNSLPKRRANNSGIKNNRASVIEEKPEIARVTDKPNDKNSGGSAKTPDIIKEVEKPEKNANDDKLEKQIEVLVATTETIYENIKVKKTPTEKPLKVSSSAQTSAVLRKPLSPKTKRTLIESKNFELLRPKDFANIYSDKTGKSGAHVYANLAQNDDLSLFFNMPKRFGELKKDFGEASVSAMNNTDTLEVNRLLRRLENAIAKGEMAEAAVFARDLAQLKINCSVIRQKNEGESSKINQTKSGIFSVEMYVEDKVSHRGPFPIQVTEDETVAELKLQVEREFEIPVNVQRWILGKELASDDTAKLKDLHITTEGCPIFLYLVAPSNEVKTNSVESKPAPVLNKESNEDTLTTSDVKIVAVKNKDVTKANVPGTSSASSNAPPLVTENKLQTQPTDEPVEEEHSEDYDTKTLKPQNEWECRVCTLLNPMTSYVCAACAIVRRNTSPKSTQKRNKKKAPAKPTKKNETDQHYLQLVNLDNGDLVENTETFECIVCFLEIAPGDGVTLRECLHQFCKNCLAHTIEFTEEAEIKCPYRDEQYSCDIALQDREIKALVLPAVYDQYLAKSVAQAENKMDKSFHCKTPDCKGWCIFEDNVNDFLCPVCHKVNCLTCQAIHMGLNCKQYQERMKNASGNDEDAKRTKDMLEEMVTKGEALICPTCQVVLMKKWGCDWLRCSMCKTEICWVTRGPRWGPGGKGDTSGGCQCGVNGIKCHPQCNYCH